MHRLPEAPWTSSSLSPILVPILPWFLLKASLWPVPFDGERQVRGLVQRTIYTYISFTSLWHNTGDNQSKRKEDFFSRIVSVHSWLLPLLWAFGKTEHHGREHNRKKSSFHKGNRARWLNFCPVGCTSERLHWLSMEPPGRSESSAHEALEATLI